MAEVKCLSMHAIANGAARWIFGAIIVSLAEFALARDDGWYTQGDFEPQSRLALTIRNPLDFDRPNSPVTVRFTEFPVRDIAEMLVTVVDPALPPAPRPTPETRVRGGPHLLQEESNGHAIFHQLDDLDRDGIWDELYFTTDLPAGGEKTIYVYFGFNQRGWNPHGTHAGIGSYARHVVPFWESAHIGWKLWFPGSVDVYAKRKGQLMSQHLYMKNWDGYVVPDDMGSDIQGVDESFGGGGICLFEDSEDLSRISRPRFTPVALAQPVASKFNAGQLSDTRYAYDVVVNGPLRSAVRIRIMNWKTPTGSYHAEQVCFAYAGENYSRCRVTFPEFAPEVEGVLPGTGFRKKPRESDFFQSGGVTISAGPETIRNPDETLAVEGRLEVDFIGGALVVPDRYAPEYVYREEKHGSEVQGNHLFRVTMDEDRSFEYMIAGAWSEGEVLTDFRSFKEYVVKAAAGMNAPAEVFFSVLEKR
jgi:hypothetical protein